MILSRGNTVASHMVYVYRVFFFFFLERGDWLNHSTVAFEANQTFLPAI